MKIKIGNKIIGKNGHCFIIAEAGVNHNGNVEIAEKLVDVAKDAGADAVKFQTFKSKDLVTANADRAEYQKRNTKNACGKESQLQMLKKLELSHKDFKLIKNYCDEKGILFLSTPHTGDAIDFLEALVPAYKIGSGDLTNIPFLKKIAKKGKPMILGTGMATMEEVKEALQAIYEEDNKEVIVLHCTTNYPCPKNEVNLRAMQTMQKELDCLIGYSDHTLGINISLMAAKLGAVVIEKHFTLDKNMEGPDHKASLEPQEFKNLVCSIRNNKFKDIDLEEEVLGSPEKKPNTSEIEIAKVARKSIVASKDIKEGEILSFGNLAIKRPGTGLKPKETYNMIGKIADKSIKKDELISFEKIR